MLRYLYTCAPAVCKNLKTIDKMSTLQKIQRIEKIYQTAFKPPVFSDSIKQHVVSQNICQLVLQSNHQTMVALLFNWEINALLCCIS